MPHDIFEDYIRKVTGNKSDLSRSSSRTEKINGSGREDLDLLKQINRKIDALSSKAGHIDGGVDIAVINGNVVIPDYGIVKASVYIDRGKIHSVSTVGSISAREVVDARDKYVLPGIIDPHVHLGLFAPLDVELETETKSALMGGITTIGCYFGGSTSYLEAFSEIEKKVNALSYTDIIPHLVINNDKQKDEIRDYAEKMNITSFKVYMNGIPGIIPDVDDGFILDVFEHVKETNKKCMVCVHSENRYLVRRASEMLENRLGDRATVVDWSETHPEMAEEEAVIRLSYLSEKAGVPVYFVHISSKEAITRLSKLKPFNKNIHVETTSPYLSISRDKLKGLLGKMEPPFRDPSDVEELWRAVENGVIDTIGTDNVTITRDEKNTGEGLWNTIPGYPAMATHLPVLLHEGVIKRGIPLPKLVGSITKRPAEIFDVYPRKGSILPGSDGDVVVVDLNLVKKVNARELYSRSDFSLYEGISLQGWPVCTIKSGEIVARDGRFIVGKKKGQILYR